jgi:hypothetical protein
MLVPLLASLLAAGSFDNVLVDSAATPAPPPPVSTPQEPAKVSPLVKNSWGLGFRLFGEAPELMIHGAVGTHSSVSLQASLSTENFSSSEEGSDLGEESSTFDLQVAIPWRTRYACRGDLCATASLGPTLRIVHGESSGTFPYGPEDDYSQSTDRTDIRCGLSGSLGAALEIFPRVFLASEMGVKGWITLGDQTSRTDLANRYQNRDGTSESQGLATWFGGLGLDFWF